MTFESRTPTSDRQVRHTHPALHDGEELQDQVTQHFSLQDPDFKLVSNDLKVFRLKFFYDKYLLWVSSFYLLKKS